MTRRWAVICLVGGLLMLCSGGGVVAAEPALNAALARYPGAVQSRAAELGLGELREGALTRQAVYWTADEVMIVEEWYAERLPDSPSTTVYTGADGCTLMSQAEVVYVFEHSRAILICTLPNGTQVVVNEKVALLP